MLMQSTGQGATHSSQPVHSGAMMVCICLAAPTMASTGQAWMHRVQPMQMFSSMSATDLGLGCAVFGVERLEFHAQQFRQLVDAVLAAGRALVDVGLAVGDRLRHRACSRESRTGRTGSAAGWRRFFRPAGLPSTLNLIAAKPSTAPRNTARPAMTRSAEHSIRYFTSPEKPMNARLISPAVTIAMADALERQPARQRPPAVRA